MNDIYESIGETFKFRLDPSDPHWLRLNDPYNIAKDEGDRWVSATAKAIKPSIDIKIPEIQGIGGTIKIRWASNGWHGIALEKSNDGMNFVPIFFRNTNYIFDEVIEIPLDPNFIYYRIWFRNDTYSSTWVYKDVEVTITPTRFTKFRIDRNSPYWVDGNATDRGDTWELNVNDYITLKTPEVPGAEGWLSFIWSKSDYGDYVLSFEKIINGDYFYIWQRAHRMPFYDKLLLPIDPSCPYYRIRIIWNSGKPISLGKDVELILMKGNITIDSLSHPSSAYIYTEVPWSVTAKIQETTVTPAVLYRYIDGPVQRIKVIKPDGSEVEIEKGGFIIFVSPSPMNPGSTFPVSAKTIFPAAGEYKISVESGEWRT